MYTVYQIKNNVNGKIYIGVTNNYKKRMREHSYASNNCVISRAIKKYGWENFETTVIDRTKDRNEAYNVLEQKYIKKADSTNPNIGYNVSIGGVGSFGFSPSDESREKMRKRKTGVPLTEEHKRKISESNKGRKFSDESRKKISEALKGNKNFQGKTFSEQTKKVLSEMKSQEWEIMSPNGELLRIRNMRKFCIDNNLHHSAMSRVLSGKQSHHKGYKKPL